MELVRRKVVCGRGVLALKSRKPLRKPGETKNSAYVHGAPIPPKTSDNQLNQEKILLSKYSYKANPDRPGGFPELTVKQGEKVVFLNAHPEQPLWWCVKQQETGNTGYVPASYMMVIMDKPSSLPWLENKKLREKKEEPVEEPQKGTFGDAPFKPYVSAYDRGGNVVNTQGGLSQERKYYCEVCDKQLNGPKPYQAHIVSKAHKEEVEAQSYN